VAGIATLFAQVLEVRAGLYVAARQLRFQLSDDNLFVSGPGFDFLQSQRDDFVFRQFSLSSFCGDWSASFNAEFFANVTLFWGGPSSDSAKMKSIKVCFNR